MHGLFSHHGLPHATRNLVGETAMFHALQEVYAGQFVVCGGKPTFVQYASHGLVWLVGFANPVPVAKIEAC